MIGSSRLEILLRSRLATAPAARFPTVPRFSSRRPPSLSYLGYCDARRSLGIYNGVHFARHPPRAAASGSRCFTSETASDTATSSVSLDPEEVTRKLVALAQKYCKEGTTISPSESLETLETREERPWDCLDTVEFVLDAEDMFGIVIPDEAADAFESIQDVVDYIVKARTVGRSDSASS